MLVHPDDQVFHRFLWRKNQSDPPTVNQWLRLDFGDKPAPDIASNAINILAKASQLEFPEAAKELQERTYVDDIGGSRSTAAVAKHVTTTIDEVLGKGQFQIKAWHSNSPAVDQTSSERYTDLLGHKWDKQEDTFALTSCLAKVLEGFTNKQAIHKAIDSGNCSVRIFFADFTKGFDLIDHSVLLDELKSFNIDQTLFFWVRSFLTNRIQAVRVGSSLSPWKQVNGGVSQGTKLGLTLFAVMINKLLKNWHMRTKYVDDTTAFEIIPRNSISVLDIVVREIHDYCIEHKMKLNPKKCKEMYIDFMKNSITTLRPISIGNKEVERVRTYKLLGVIISDDLKWNAHAEYVIAKAAKRLYALRLMKRAGVMPKDILKVYLCNVRSVLEYAVQVWQDIPAYLSDAIESIQRRALGIIFPNSSYQQALYQANLTSLAGRRELLCQKLMADMRDVSHPISFLAPQETIRTIPYQLRSGNTIPTRTMKKTKRANDFFTFRFG